MIIEIEHRTTYRYSLPVHLDCQSLRLRPRQDGTQRLQAFETEVQPAPLTASESVDAEGNAVTQVCFGPQPSDVFEVVVRSRVETLLANPFQFVLPGHATRLPVEYPADVRTHLAGYLREHVPVEPTVASFAHEIAKRADGDCVAFLAALTRDIRQRSASITRAEGPAWPAEVTLDLRTGACRDLTVLLMESARALGFATRFVSGYHLLEGEGANHELHAWAEVYLPGVGWRGYDATTGLAVAQRHVPVAAAATPAGAAPLTGTFRGPMVTSILATKVHVRAVGNDAGES